MYSLLSVMLGNVIDLVATLIVAVGIIHAPTVSDIPVLSESPATFREQVTQSDATTSVSVATSTVSIDMGITASTSIIAPVKKSKYVYENWRTFSDDKYKLQFKYPHNWEFGGLFNHNNTLRLGFVVDGGISMEGNGGSVDIEVSIPNNDFSSDIAPGSIQASNAYSSAGVIDGIKATITESTCSHHTAPVTSFPNTGGGDSFVCLKLDFTKGNTHFKVNVNHIRTSEVIGMLASFETPPAKPASKIVNVSSMDWMGNFNPANLTIQQISLGRISAPAGLHNDHGGVYKEGEEVYALTINMILSSLLDTSFPSPQLQSFPLVLKSIDPKTGAEIWPNSDMVWDTNKILPVIFVVSEYQKTFLFQVDYAGTPDPKKTYRSNPFSVTVSGNSLIFSGHAILPVKPSVSSANTPIIQTPVPPVVTKASSHTASSSSVSSISNVSQGSTISVRRIYNGFNPKDRVISEIATSTTDVITRGPGTNANSPFIKDEVIAVARQLGFTTGFDVNLVGQRFAISEGAAKNTGQGTAWFISGQDYHASVSYCPVLGGGFSNVIKLDFEMNKITGDTYIKTMCQPTIVD